MVSVGVSTNHVGERRNFCFAKIRRPVLRAIRFGFITNLCRCAVLGNIMQFIVHIPHD